MKTKNRIDLLKEASSLTNGDRLKDYGDPVSNHQHIADIFNAISGRDLSAREIVLVHEATKIARRQKSPRKRDHYVDNMAYVGIHNLKLNTTFILFQIHPINDERS